MFSVILCDSMHELRTEPRQRRSQQSIDAILDAAQQLIYRHGQVSFTANELAIAANMSIGRVYYWFPDIPSVVSALAERSSDRMYDEFATLVERERTTTTPALIRRTVDSLSEFIERNPATPALCLTGGADGYGKELYQRLTDLVAGVVLDRVEDVPEAEAAFVARTAVGVLLGMLNSYTRAPAQDKENIRQELAYVLSSWIYCRYPSPDDPIWERPGATIRPARKPKRATYTTMGSSYPVILPPLPST